MKYFSLLLCLLLSQTLSFSQSNITIVHQYDIAADCKGIAMTMKHDQGGKPYLYVACKEAGLKVYDVSVAPVLVKSIPITSFGSLHVVSLSQSGDYVYLALGNSFANSNQAPGFAIVDVKDPTKATLISWWTDTKLKGGGGIVECRDNYVYLGAMKNGLMIFDVSDKSKIVFVAKLMPDIHFPETKADPAKYNARGMAIQKDLLYLCFDAGGLRIINIADKAHPTEIGRYANPALIGKPRAYNNIVVDDTLVYVTVDYVGMEVLSVANPAKIRSISWWNPWNPKLNGMNWFKSEGHTNEIDYDKKNKLVFIAAGKSDLVVLDVSKAAAPKQCAFYGGPNNDLGTWGVSVYKNNIYLAYICAYIPFSSKWTGVKALTY